MLFCSLLVINKEPCRVDVFPELLINPSKQKLVMIESNKLNQQLLWHVRTYNFKRSISGPKQKNKMNNHLQIQNIWMYQSLCTKFPLNQKNLDFWNKFVQKWCFPFKIEKVYITIRFSIIKLLSVPNFSLYKWFWFFTTKYALIGYFQSKTENVNITIKFC